jgi:hypothetical protein
MSTTPMAFSALDFLVDEHDLTTPIPRARFVHAGTPMTPAPHAVHGTVPVHAPVATPQSTPAPPSPGPGSPSSPSTGATAPVHPAQAAASNATSALSTAPSGAAAPVPSARVAASSTTTSSHTVNTLPVSIAQSPMRTPCARAASLASHSLWIASTSTLSPCHLCRALFGMLC